MLFIHESLPPCFFGNFTNVSIAVQLLYFKDVKQPLKLTDFDFSAHGTVGRPRQLLGGIFQTVHDKNGDFLGIASVSFRGRTPLLPGHHLTATDGTSITVSHTTRVGSGKSVVAVIGGLIAFFHTTKEMTARSSRTSCTEITNGCFHMKSSVHKRVSFFQEFKK